MGEGKQLEGDNVVIFDNDGYFMGVSLSEMLAEEGKKVTLMTPMGHVASYMHFTLEAPNQHRRLHKLGVEIVPYHLPTRVEQGAVVAAHVYDEHGHEKSRSTPTASSGWRSDARTRRCSGRSRTRSASSSSKAEGVDALYRIGDCEAPRLTADAVFSGHRLAREIDSPDPSIPLPFKRERRMVDDASVATEKVEYAASTPGRRLPRCVSSSASSRCGARGRGRVRERRADVDPDYLDPALNEWDCFATEEALRLAGAPRGRGRPRHVWLEGERRLPCDGAWRWAPTGRSGSRLRRA